MSSGSSAGLKGGSWSSKIYFFDYSQPGQKEPVELDLSNPDRQLGSEINDGIQETVYYKGPLSKFQGSKINAFHAFIVIKTRSFYWSIEKNQKGIFLQRSSRIEDIQSKLNGQNRTQNFICKVEPEILYADNDRIKSSLNILLKLVGLEQKLNEEVDLSEQKLKDVLERICDGDEINKEYDIVIANCQAFAYTIFNFLRPGVIADVKLCKMLSEYVRNN